MRQLILILAIVTLAGSTAAQELGSSRKLPRKNSPQVTYVAPSTVPGDGDNIGDAWVITGLPFSTTGSTDGYLDDYDEICPYDTPGSPDVVYSFTPGYDIMIAVDLCGSLYDTKTYIYDGDFNVIACNDDYYNDDGCGIYVSKIVGAALTAGVTYFIVIDGYGGAFGDYQLLVEEFIFYEINCPADAILEGEPPLVEGYQDQYNSGCGGEWLLLQPIDWINDDDGQPPYAGYALLCGKSGWYSLTDDLFHRDTDWFVTYARETGVMDVIIEAEFPSYIFKLGPTNCAEVGVEISAQTDYQVPAAISFPVTAGEEIWLWVGPRDFDGPIGEFTYFMTVSNNEFNTVPTQKMSWGKVKSLYR